MEEWEKRIEINPKIMGGKPVIKGTRVTVEAIIGRLAEGMSVKEILKDFPYLTKKDIEAALKYVEYAIKEEIVIPVKHVFGRRKSR